MPDNEEVTSESEQPEASEQDITARIAGLFASEEETEEESEPESKKTPPASETDDAAESTEEEEEEAEETETLDEPSAPKKHRITVDGETLEVDEEELKRGYSRTASFTRKSQSLAKDKKEFEAEREAVRNERETYVHLLGKLRERVEAEAGTPPDLADYEGRETGYVQAVAAYTSKTQRIAAIKAQEAETRNKLAREQFQAMEKYAQQQEEALLDALPDWKKPDVREKETAGLVAYARSLGFSPEELAEIRDHRILLVLRDAERFNRAVKRTKTSTPATKQTPTVKPGPAKKPEAADKKAIANAGKRLAKTGSVDAAAELYLRLGLGDE